MLYICSNKGGCLATAIVQRGYNIRHLGYKASPAMEEIGLCKWKSCLKPSKQEEESFSSHVLGGLHV